MSEKKKTIESFLEHQYCLLQVNPAVPGTVLPDHLAKEITVTLKVSHFFAGYVSVDEDKVMTLLTFGATPTECTIPLKAIWAVISDLGDLAVWEEDAPHPMLVAMIKEKHGAPPQAKPTPKAVPSLKVASETPQPQSSDKEEKRERPNFLKRVK